MENAKPLNVLSVNLRELMREARLTKPQLAQKSGVSERMIGYILAREKTPTADVIDALARAFGLEGWQILIPGLRVDIAHMGKITRLVQNYSVASDKGREYIDHVAEQEALYQAAAGKKS